jgi:hypothetical protein
MERPRRARLHALVDNPFIQLQRIGTWLLVPNKEHTGQVIKYASYVIVLSPYLIRRQLASALPLEEQEGEQPEWNINTVGASLFTGHPT